MPPQPLPITYIPTATIAADLDKYMTYPMSNSKYLLYSPVALPFPELAVVTSFIEEEYYKWLGETQPDDESSLLHPASQWDFSGRTLQDVLTTTWPPT